MAESEGIQEIVNQTAIQAVTALMMALQDVDEGPQIAPMVSLKEPQRDGGPAPRK